MNEVLDYLENHKLTAIFIIVGALVIFALFFQRREVVSLGAGGPSAMCAQAGGCTGIYAPQPAYAPTPGYPVQPGYAPQSGYASMQGYGLQPKYNSQIVPQRNCLMYPTAPGCPMAPSYGSMQPVALQSGTLTLAMGVTLEGRGTVVSVEPGSSADRAGIQPGDLINRINGK